MTTDKSPYNLPWLRKERDWVSEQLTKGDLGELDMTTWSNHEADRSCGTTYCVAGHMATVSPGVAWSDGGNFVRPADGTFMDIELWAGNELGLNSWERKDLFYCNNDQVLDKLDELIRRGEELERKEQ